MKRELTIRDFLARGYTLAEMAIVLVIVGLLLGGALVPAIRLSEGDRYNFEERRLERAKDAVIAYAFRHRTLLATVTFEVVTPRPGLATLTVTFPHEFPGSRPYLPCPDLDGDGLEDRIGFDPWGMGNRWPVSAYGDTRNRSNFGELTYTGVCASRRGALPHRTLGLPPADSWGNRYTYEVDEIFSDALFGFSENSRIDSFDIRLPLLEDSLGEVFLQKRGVTVAVGRANVPYRLPVIQNRFGATVSIVSSETLGDVFYRSEIPIVVCDGDAEYFDSQVCQRYTSRRMATIAAAMDTDGFNLGTGTPNAGLPLLAGELSSGAGVNLLRRYSPQDTTEGLPFVIVSHGKNGRGAMGHSPNIEHAAENLAAHLEGNNLGRLEPVCNPPLHLRLTVDAAYTARGNSTEVFAEMKENVNFPFVIAPIRGGSVGQGRTTLPLAGLSTLSCLRVEYHTTEGSDVFANRVTDGHFVQATREEDGFDDILIWATRDEIIEILSRSHALPAPDFRLIDPPR